MKYIISFFLLLSVTPSHGAIMSVQAGAGMLNGIFNLAIDVDYQKKRSHSFGGYLVYGQGKEATGANASRGQFWSVGGDFKAFFGPRSWKLYVAPGVGVISYETVTGSESETSFGTMMKVGALYRLAPNMYVGLEQMFLQTWFSSKAYGGYYLLSNLAFRMNF